MTDGVQSEDGKGRRGRRPSNEDTTGNQRVSDEVMHHLVSQGCSGPEIVKILWDEYGVPYTRQGVSVWRRKHNVPVRVRSKNMENLVPWRILPQHENHRLIKYLRSEARQRDGLPLDGPSEYRYQAVAHELRRLKGVVYYDRENGFQIVAPREGIDNDLIYDPRLADDGSLVEDPELWQ